MCVRDYRWDKSYDSSRGTGDDGGFVGELLAVTAGTVSGVKKLAVGCVGGHCERCGKGLFDMVVERGWENLYT